MVDLTLTLRVPGTGTTFPIVDAMGEEIARVLTRYYGEGEVRYLHGTAVQSPPEPRVVTRRGKYRDKRGFVVRAYASGRNTSTIFTETETSATKIRARLLAGEDVRSSDFLP